MAQLKAQFVGARVFKVLVLYQRGSLRVDQILSKTRIHGTGAYTMGTHVSFNFRGYNPYF